MNAFVKFTTGLFRMPVGVQIWQGFLVAANLVVPLFFLTRIEAQVVLATFFLSFMLMVMITWRAGFGRLLGLGHILFIPMIIFLLMQLNLHPLTEVYGIWMLSCVGLNGISLVLDGNDVVRYVAGDRAERVIFKRLVDQDEQGGT